MDDINKKLAELEAKIDAIYKSVEKTRRYFQIVLIATVVTFVLPLIGLIIIIPFYIGQLKSMYSGLL